MTAYVFMSARFKDRMPGGNIAVARRRSRQATLCDEVHIVDDKGRVLAKVTTSQTPQRIGDHAVRGWVEIYDRRHMVVLA